MTTSCVTPAFWRYDPPYLSGNPVPQHHHADERDDLSLHPAANAIPSAEVDHHWPKALKMPPSGSFRFRHFRLCTAMEDDALPSNARQAHPIGENHRRNHASINDFPHVSPHRGKEKDRQKNEQRLSNLIWRFSNRWFGGRSIEPGPPAALLHESQHDIDGGRGHANKAAEIADGGHERVNFH